MSAPSGGSPRPFPSRAVGLLLLSVVLFVVGTLLSVADDGAKIGWYTWAAFAASATALIAGLVLLVRRPGRS